MRVLRGDEMVKCPVLKGMPLTGVGMLRRKALRDRVTRSDAVQQAALSNLQGRVKCYEKRGDRVMRELELAAVAVEDEKAALEIRKEDVTEKSKKCGRSVAQLIERAFRL